MVQFEKMNTYKESDYFIFEDRSLRLERCLIVFIVLVFLSAENVRHDRYKYRRSVLSLLYVLFFCEVTSYIFKVNEYEAIQKLIHKFGVELVYIILNCSICYNINKFLAKSSQSLSLIVYGSIGIIFVYILVLNTKYSKVARAILFAVGAILSCYTLSILYRLRSYFTSLSDLRQDIIIPVSHNALFRSEWIILILNIFMCCYCLVPNPEGVHLVNQIRVCIKILYLFKIYIVMTEWRNVGREKDDLDHSNDQFKDTSSSSKQQFQSQQFEKTKPKFDNINALQLRTQNNKTYIRVNTDDVDTV